MAQSSVKPKKIAVLRKRGLDEWTDAEQDNLKMLRGIAMQCLSYKEVAECIGVTEQTLHNWRKKSPEFAEAIDIGRGEADAVVIAVSFDAAVRGDNYALDRWFRYRIAPNEKTNVADTQNNGKLDELIQAVGGIGTKKSDGG